MPRRAQAAELLAATAILDQPATVDRTCTYDRPTNELDVIPAAARVPRPLAPAGYELLDELGIGGMGTVYLARDQTTDRLVAMKFLQRTGSQGAYDRFLVELRALAGLDHPNIIRVLGHDFLRADPYFITEYIPGGTLSKKLETEGVLSPRGAAELMATAARAVHAANVSHVVHRDLKPSNILLAADGSPRVSDFGLAKRTDRDDEVTHGTGTLGTPAYMSPEQARGSDVQVNERTDVYGLGATLYHIVTGRPPFTGPHDEVTRRVLNEPPVAPRVLRRDLPLELEAIILKCLEKDPARRYPNAEALAADLDRFLAGAVPDAPLLTWQRRVAIRARRNRRAIAVACGGALLILAALGVWLAMRPVDPLEQMQKDLRAGRSVTLIGRTGLPRWHEWRLGAAALGTSPVGDETCYFESIGDCLLELCPDPQVEHYRISVEMRQLRALVVRGADGKPLPDMEFTGLYFGYMQTAVEKGSPSRKFYAVGFREILANSGMPAISAQLRFRQVLSDGGVDKEFETKTLNLTQRQLAMVPAMPPPWRRIEIEVSSDAIRVWWNENSENPHSKSELITDWELADPGPPPQFIDHVVTKPGRPPYICKSLPGWQPRLPIGVWCYRSAVSLRNLTITPLP